MTSNAPRGSGIIGSLRSAGGKGVVRMEARVETDIENLWSALTEPARLSHWLGEVEGDLRPGGEFRARFVASGWEGAGRVETCEPPQRLLVLTRDADEPPDQPYGHALEASLTAAGGRTVLVWEERGMPSELLAPYGAGIQIHVEDLLDYLAGRERREAGPRFAELHDAYRDLAAEVGQPTS